MTPKPLPGLSLEESGSPAEIESSKRKTPAESANVNTNAKRAKLDEPATEELPNHSSELSVLTSDLNTVMSGLTKRLSTMKLLLTQGNYSDIEQLAEQAPDVLRNIRILDKVLKDQVKKTMQKRWELEEKVAEWEKVRSDNEENLRAQLAEKDVMEKRHESALRSVMGGVSSVTVFRAMLKDDEVTVSFTTISKSQEAIVTIHDANHRKLVWYDKLDKCVASINNWDWILCLDQGPGRPAIHLHHLEAQDVTELPIKLRRDTGRGACYCQESGV